MFVVITSQTAAKNIAFDGGRSRSGQSTSIFISGATDSHISVIADGTELTAAIDTAFDGTTGDIDRRGLCYTKHRPKRVNAAIK